MNTMVVVINGVKLKIFHENTGALIPSFCPIVAES